MEINNFENKKMKQTAETISKWKKCYLCKEKIEGKHPEDKNYFKVRDHCLYTGKYKPATHRRKLNKQNHLKKFL